MKKSGISFNEKSPIKLIATGKIQVLTSEPQGRNEHSVSRRKFSGFKVFYFPGEVVFQCSRAWEIP